MDPGLRNSRSASLSRRSALCSNHAHDSTQPVRLGFQDGACMVVQRDSMCPVSYRQTLNPKP